MKSLTLIILISFFMLGASASYNRLHSKRIEMLEANTRLDKAIDLGNHELIDQALFDTMRLNSEYLHEQNRTHWDEPNYYNQPRLNDDADATRVDKQRHPNMKDIPNNNYGDWDGFYDY